MAFFGLALAILLYGFWWIGIASPFVHIYKANVRDVNRSDLEGYLEVQTIDLLKVLENQYYVNAIIYQCGLGSNFYPSELKHIETYLSDFPNVLRKMARRPNRTVVLMFSVPKSVWNNYSDPCIRLSGSQMIGIGRVKSNQVRVTVLGRRA